MHGQHVQLKVYLFIYFIDNSAISYLIDLNETITLLSIRKTFYNRNDSYMALFMALKLNEKAFIVEIIENIDPGKGKRKTRI